MILTPAHIKAIELIESPDFTMSFTKCERFWLSPWSLVCYVAAKIDPTADKEPTAAMKLGRLEHCVVLEPEELQNRYIVFRKSDPGKTWGQQPNKQIKADAIKSALEQGKEAIDGATYDGAIRRGELIKHNRVAGELLEGCTYFEQSVKWQLLGLHWRGIIDGGNSSYKIDIKKVQNAKRSKIRWIAKDRHFSAQAYLYNTALGNYDRATYYNICIDNAENVITLLMDPFSIDAGRAWVEDVIEKFIECRVSGNWDYNQEFWSDKGYYSMINL
mgnify:CR=1 FL=1